MRVLSDWRLRGMLGLVVVAGGLGWMGSQHATGSALPLWMGKLLPAALAPQGSAPAQPVLLADYGKTPLHFEPNVGQAHRDVKYLARGAGYSLLLTADEAVLHLSRPVPGSRRDDPEPRMERAVLRAQLVNANRKPRLQAEDKLPGYSNYFIGNDPRQWHSGVANYGRVRYEQVWPGIDLVYYGNQQQLEYDFVVQPGVDPDTIRLRYLGADRLHVDETGNLVADTPLGPVLQQRPVVYQDIGGQRRTVASHYTLAGNEVGFALGDYDRSQPLVIDPVLVYSSYLGGGSNGNFNLTAIAVAGNGAAYVTGYTDSASFPTVSPYQVARSAPVNTVVTRFANNGRSLAWSTYLGGSGSDASGRAAAIAVDADGNAWVAGTTLASNFPMAEGVTPYQATGNSLGAGFLAKLSRDGQNLLYSTYLSGTTSINGSAGDAITGLALAGDGSVWLAGSAGSSNFPVSGNALQPANAGSNPTGFVSHLAADGQSLDYSSYLGGSGSDLPTRIVLAAGNVFLAGRTNSSDFPVTDSSQLNGTGTGSASDAFLVRLSASGESILQARYLGGSGNDVAWGLAVDSSGNAFVAGATQSSDFPVQYPLTGEGSKSGSGDTAFLTRYNNDGSLAFSTFLGSAGYASSVALTSSGEPVVAGHMAATFRQEDPVKNGGTPVTPVDAGNAFIRRLSADGQNLPFSTALGADNSDDETINGIAVDSANAIYVVGTTLSNSFPIRNPARSYSPAFNRSGFVSKLGNGPELGLILFPPVTAMDSAAILHWESTGATSCSWDDAGDLGLTGDRSVVQSSPGIYEYTLRCSNADGTRTETASLQVVPPPEAELSLSPTTVVAGQETTLSWTSSYTTSCSLTATDQDDSSLTLVSESGDVVNGSLTFTPPITGIYTFTLNCRGPGSSQYTEDSKTLTIIDPPTVSFSSSATGSSFLNDSLTLNWSSTGAQSCSAEATPANAGWSGSQATSGSATVTLGTVGSQAFKLICKSSTGFEQAATQNFVVYDGGTPPAISLVASPTSIPLYHNSTLTWNVSNAQSCQASANPATVAWTGSRGFSGSQVVKPAVQGNQQYTLTCLRPAPGGGTVPASVAVNVTVTEPVDAPTLSFVATPAEVAVNNPVALSWNSQYTDSCTASGASGWSGSKQVNGSFNFRPDSTGTLTLSLSCINGAGDTVTKSHVITVIKATGTNSGNEGDGGSSGGPVDLLLLGGLGLLGLARRRQRPC